MSFVCTKVDYIHHTFFPAALLHEIFSQSSTELGLKIVSSRLCVILTIFRMIMVKEEQVVHHPWYSL